MNINFYLSESELEALLNFNDPERETWDSINDLTPEDVDKWIQNILDAWIDRNA